MKNLPVFSTVAAGLCLFLSIWLFFIGRTSVKLQSELLRQQESFQGQQREIQLGQQQLQAQQNQIDVSMKLAQEIGPAILRDLATLAVQNKNKEIEDLLAKHGFTLTQKTGEAETPAPQE